MGKVKNNGFVVDVYHATLVHYKKKNYTQPTSVQYWDVSQWYN